MNVSIINPLEYPNWDELLLTSNCTTFFHTSGWARVLSESYGYQPIYFAIIDSGQLTGLLPVMEIRSFITGKRGVSLPFTDMCNPVARNRETFNLLLDKAVAHGKKAGWKNLEIRGGEVLLRDEPSAAELFFHTLNLNGDEQSVFRRLRGSTRRNTRKAEKEGITAVFERSPEAMSAFYRLHCGTRRYHGLPPQPFGFFEKIQEHVIAKGNGFLVLAAYKQKTVAAAVYFSFQNNQIYKFGASDRKFLHLRPNNLVMWQAIQWSCRMGAQSLNLGRTETNNEGLSQFKRGWGASEFTYRYYKYDLQAGGFVADTNGLNRSSFFFRILPIPLLQVAGHFLYKHVG